MNWFNRIMRVVNVFRNWRCPCGHWNPIWAGSCQRCKCIKGARG